MALPLVPIALFGLGALIAAKVRKRKESDRQTNSSNRSSSQGGGRSTSSSRPSGYSSSQSRTSSSQSRSQSEYKTIDEKICEWNPLDLCYATKPSYMTDTGAKKTLNEFFSDIELAVMDDEDRTMAEKVLRCCPNLKRNSYSLDDAGDIYITYNRDRRNALYNFIETIKHPESDRFWIDVFLDDNKEKDTYFRGFVLFTEEESVLTFSECEESNLLLVSEVYSGKKFPRARRIIDSLTHTKWSIPASKIHFVNTDLDVYWQGYLDPYIWDLKTMNLIIPDPKYILRELGTDAIKAFDEQKRYLEFQKREDEAPVSVIIPSGRRHSRTVFSENEHEDAYIAYQLDITDDEFEKIKPDDRFGYTPVEILHTDGTIISNSNVKSSKWTCYGSIIRDGDDVILKLSPRSSLSEQELSNGVMLKRRTNETFYTHQIGAIEQFTDRRNSKSIFNKLILGELKPARRISDISFYDSRLSAAESENSQPDAVRMALGAKDIALIQGPPGTGKTTVIVEIIKQLVKSHKRVLVCSQTHAAVDNIEEKIASSDTKIEYVDIRDKDKNFMSLDKDDYKQYIQNIAKEIDHLSKGDSGIDSLVDSFSYSSKQAERFGYLQFHKELITQYPIQRAICKRYDSITEDLLSSELNENMLELSYYRSRDVVLGTCIGIGMNRALKRGNIHFDVVIIDEAAKANLSEALVPMSMGDKFILVGDDNQLPAYLDTEVMERYLCHRYGKDNITPEIRRQTEKLLSMSLFEFLNSHTRKDCKFKFPEENVVMLNYQYRMHPDIGNLVSTLFYDGKLRMGDGTDKKVIQMDNLNEQFRFFDIRGREIHKYDSTSNPAEAKYLVQEILPQIIDRIDGTDLTLGIITPYSAQRKEIRNRITEKKYRDCVYTIDSIQGKEYDIVIFSFVRSFPEDCHAPVGFIDDMRRLNVALSRARKKLLLVGDKATLEDPRNHRQYSKGDPRKIYPELLKITSRVERDPLTHQFLQNFEEGEKFIARYERIVKKEKNGKDKEHTYLHFQKDGKQYDFETFVKGIDDDEIPDIDYDNLHLYWKTDQNSRPVFIIDKKHYTQKRPDAYPVGTVIEGTVTKATPDFCIVAFEKATGIMFSTPGSQPLETGFVGKFRIQKISKGKPMPQVVLADRKDRQSSQSNASNKLCNTPEFRSLHKVGSTMNGEIIQKNKKTFIVKFPDGLGILPMEGYDDLNVGDKGMFSVSSYQSKTNIPFLEFYGNL